MIVVGGIEQLGSWHDRVRHRHVDVMERHRIDTTAVRPVVGELLKGINLLKPLPFEQLVMDLTLVLLKTLFAELWLLYDLFRSANVIIRITRCEVLQLIFIYDLWIVSCFVYETLGAQKVVLIKTYLRIH